MKTLYELNANQALDYSIRRVQENHPELSKKEARILVLNSLVYNVVIAEVSNMVDYLIEGEEAI